MIRELLRYTRVLSIVGDILKIRARDVGLGDLAIVENWDGEKSLAQVIERRGAPSLRRYRRRSQDRPSCVRQARHPPASETVFPRVLTRSRSFRCLGKAR